VIGPFGDLGAKSDFVLTEIFRHVLIRDRLIIA
jgi:hypothetical protein